MKLPRILLATGLVALLAPAVANADSIVYIDQGNVWSAAPDGAHKVQLTDRRQLALADPGRRRHDRRRPGHRPDPGDGPRRPAAADDHDATARSPATAARSRRVRSSSPSRPTARRSPTRTCAYSCPVASTCGSIQRSTFYTHADVTTATPISVYGNQFSVSNPEWVTNSRTLVFGGYGRQVAIDDLGAGDYNAKPWMVPNGDMGDGEVTRDGKRLAVTVRLRREHEAQRSSPSPATSRPSPARVPGAARAAMTNPDAERSPTRRGRPTAPGSRARAARASTVSRFTEFGPASARRRTTCVLSATGSEPDWGPADAARRRLHAAGDPRPTPTPTPAPEPTPPSATLALAKATAKALRKGLAVKVTVPGAGQGDAHRHGQGPQGRERHAHGQAGRHGHGEALEGPQVAEGQDPHPQVDLQ